MSETMTINDIQAKLEKIDKCKADDEAAHTMQDVLWESVLQAIASGECQNPQECAAEALKVLEIDFCRWYA